ncbi:MAG: 50S ribosomal protein L5 [bacterium]|nr:50S ribosomal protein L5 [bacterium]
MADKKKKKEAEHENVLPTGYRSRLREEYANRILPEMMKSFGYKNVMQAPRLEKIVINMGLGEAARDAKMLEGLRENLAQIAGQQPVITKAKKSISNFKLREGMNVGLSVTLRRDRMLDFLDRFVNICVPRIRDFRGLSNKSFDGRGNYSMGVQEQLIFPEIHYDGIPRVQGMNICIVTSAKTDEEALALLRLYGVPFRN